VGGAGHAGSSTPGKGDLYLVDGFIYLLERVEQTGGEDDCRTLLVVMNDRDIQPALEDVFGGEGFGRTDVFEVDSLKGWSDGCDHFDELLRIAHVYRDVKDIDIREFF
jgi:hypothetical protein